MKKLTKIDIHVHTVKSPGLPRPDGSNYALPNELIRIYDEIGIEKGVLLPEIWTECSYDTANNRETEEIVAANPDRFAWFCAVDPRQGWNSPDTDFSYFLNYYKSRGARGVGEISSNLYFDDPLMMNLFSHCETCRMPVIFHMGFKGYGDYGIADEFDLHHMEAALKAFPKLKFLGHSQKFWSHISGDVTPEQWNGYPKGKVVPGGRIVELMEKYPNLCCDLSAGSGCGAMTRDPEFTYSFMEKFADRIYYGTDICSPTNYTAAKKLSDFLDDAMKQGCISYETYEKICCGNAEKLLRGEE